MTKFQYKARNSAGEVVEGHPEAVDAKTLRKILDEKNYFLIEFSEYKKQSIKQTGISFLFKRSYLKELSVFSWQLFTMLDSGMPLLNSLRLLRGQIKNIRIGTDPGRFDQCAIERLVGRLPLWRPLGPSGTAVTPVVPRIGRIVRRLTHRRLRPAVSA